VGELASGLPVSRPAVSQHLKVLKEAGLVREERRGTRGYYSIEPRGLEPLRAYLESFWGEVLVSFAAFADDTMGGRNER
jgi:DNA-binding transcriptional ArsR family regulator